MTFTFNTQSSNITETTCIVCVRMCAVQMQSYEETYREMGRERERGMEKKRKQELLAHKL